MTTSNNKSFGIFSPITRKFSSLKEKGIEFLVKQAEEHFGASYQQEEEYEYFDKVRFQILCATNFTHKKSQDPVLNTKFQYIPPSFDKAKEEELFKNLFKNDDKNQSKKPSLLDFDDDFENLFKKDEYSDKKKNNPFSFLDDDDDDDDDWLNNKVLEDEGSK